MKKLLLLLSLIFLLSACSDNEEDTSDNLFSDISLSESIDSDWLFIPEGSTLIRTEEVDGELKATFKGCEFKEINAYAKELYELLVKTGSVVYDATNPLQPKKIDAFKEANLDIKFAGLAYCYYYTKGDSIYMLTIHYYGSAGGAYGNGQSVVGLSEVTDKIGSLIKG